MKNYKTNLTKNYVSNWTVIDAIREILQNAIDNANGLKIDYNKENETLKIISKNTVLSTKDLLIGNSTKIDDKDKIGQFGEGFKLALLVLKRRNHDPIIENGEVNWTPEFIYNEDYEFETFTIIEEKRNKSKKDLTFVINNVDENIINHCIENFIPFKEKFQSDSKLVVRKGTNGDLLMNPEERGNVYVGGLFLNFDDDLSYGYNFKPSLVKLGRDRSALNWGDLKNATAKTIVNLKSDIEAVKILLKTNAPDTENLKYNISNIPNSVKTELVKEIKKRNKIAEDDKVYATDKTEVLMHLNSNNKTSVKMNKTIATIVNKVQDIYEETEEVEELIRNIDDQERGLKNLKDDPIFKLNELLKLEKLENREEIQKILISVCRNHISYFRHIKNVEDIILPEKNKEEYLKYNKKENK